MTPSDSRVDEGGVPGDGVRVGAPVAARPRVDGAGRPERFRLGVGGERRVGGPARLQADLVLDRPQGADDLAEAGGVERGRDVQRLARQVQARPGALAGGEVGELAASPLTWYAYW